MSGLDDILKQAQAMQAQMEKTQRELADIEVRGEAGGGLVAITMTCRHDVRKVEVAPKLLGEEREVLEDLIAAAINDAVRKVEQAIQQKMGGMAQGLTLPDLKSPL